MNAGYVKYYRKIKEWQWYMDIPCRLIFMHLLIMANFAERKYKNITIKPGEYVTTLENLAKENGLSIQQTRTALRKLKSTNDITIKSTNKYTIITLTNWGTYQNTEDYSNNQINKQSNNQSTNKQQTLYINKKARKKESITHVDDFGPYNNHTHYPSHMEEIDRQGAGTANTYQDQQYPYPRATLELGYGYPKARVETNQKALEQRAKSLLMLWGSHYKTKMGKRYYLHNGDLAQMVGLIKLNPDLDNSELNNRMAQFLSLPDVGVGKNEERGINRISPTVDRFVRYLPRLPELTESYKERLKEAGYAII